jgi:hypothetical protein
MQLAVLCGTAYCALPTAYFLKFKFINIVNTNGIKLAINIYDQGNGDGSFCRGNGHDNQSEEVSFQPVRKQVMVEGNKVDVHGIQHEFNTHEHRDQVSADEHAHQSDKEYNRAEHNHVVEWYFSLQVHTFFFCAIKMEPTKAANNNTLITSNGNA